MRAGAGLGVVLDGGAGDVAQDQALDRAVVEVQLRELGDAEVGLPADRLVALDPRLAARALDREAVVLGGDVDPPRLQVLDRVVGAAVAEGQLVGLAGRPRGRAAGGRGRCRRPAACRSRRGPCRPRSRARPGRRGRWRGRRRRGPRRAPPRGRRCRAAGSAWQPCSRSWRTMLSLIPVSIPTTCGPSPSKRTGFRRGDGAGEVGAGHRGLGGDLSRAPRPRGPRPGRCRRASRRGRGCGGPARGCRCR